MKNFNIVFDDRETTQTHMKCHLMANISNNNRNSPSQLKKNQLHYYFQWGYAPQRHPKIEVL